MITDSLGQLSFGLFLLAVLGTFALGAAYIAARLLRRPAWARAVLRLELAGAALYVVLYLLAGATSRNRDLAFGEEKHICEIDCHLAYAVTGVRTARTWGPDTTRGHFTIVTVRVRFDSATISPQRPRTAPVWPGSRNVTLVDAVGHRFDISAQPLARSLLPGEAYTADFAFDLPDGTRPVRLVLRSGDWPTRLMIAHENAWLHGKVTFRLNG